MPNIKDAADMTPQSRWETTVDAAVTSMNGSDSRAKVSDQSLVQLANEVAEFFQGQWSKTARELGSEDLAGPDAARMGNDALEDFAASTFAIASVQGGSVANDDVRSAVVNANRLAAEKIIATRQRYGETPPVQVVPFRCNGTDEIRFSVIKQAPEIENPVLRGGSAKGAGYPPTLVKLEKHGMTNGVEQVVGTSAGALTAALLAAGLSAEQFQMVSDAHDIASFKDKPPWDTRYPNLKFGMLGFQAGAAMELVDRESANSVKAFLDSDDGQAKIAAAVREGWIDADDADALEALRHQNFEVDRTIQMVTFRDLDSLSKIAPGKFKSLTLTGWNDTDKTLSCFNAKDTPHVPIAIAGRISMSLPEMTSKTHELVDARSRTMRMTFDESGKPHKIQYGPPLQPAAGGLASAIVSHIAGNPEYAAAAARDREQVYNAGPNGLVAFHGEPGTLSLSPGMEPEDAAVLGAPMRTAEAIAQRQNQATYEIFADLASAASSLSPDERTAFLHAGPPNPQAFANSDGIVDERLHQAAVQFYEEAARLNTSCRPAATTE